MVGTLIPHASASPPASASEECPQGTQMDTEFSSW